MRAGGLRVRPGHVGRDRRPLSRPRAEAGGRPAPGTGHARARGLGSQAMSEITIDGFCILGADREFDLTAEALLRDMDRSGVQQAVIAPVDRCLAVHNREGNACLLQTAAAHPSRLIPACSVNPWYGEAAKEELKR